MNTDLINDEAPSEVSSEARSAGQLFNEALVLEEHWYVESVEFDCQAGKVVLHLNFHAGGFFTCGSCGRQGCRVYDASRRYWRHLDFLQYKTYFCAPHPRVECPRCGVRQSEVSWARPRSSYTVPFEFRIAELKSGKMTFRYMAMVLEEPRGRIQRVARHYLELRDANGREDRTDGDG